MTRERSEQEGERRTASDPVGTMLGLTFGPFGAAVGSVVDSDRFAMKFSFGTGARDAARGDGLEDATTVEIVDASDADSTATDDGESGAETDGR
jgi:hypothetical protein